MLSMYIRLTSLLARLRSDEHGVTAVEYGLMAAAIAGVIGVAAFALGNKVSGALSAISLTAT